MKLTDEGDFLIRTADLKAMGFRDPKGRITEIEGEPYVSLKSMEGVTFVLDGKTASLDITASPDLLPKRSIDLLSPRPPKVFYPRDSGAFLNYRFDYTAGDSFRFSSFNFTNEAGVRLGDFLLYSDSIFTKTKDDETFVRLLSNITYDRRKEMQRIIAGDFSASSGDLGSTVIMGGISFSKIYQIDPYFIRYPVVDFRGLALLPSDVEIYLDGTLIRREKLPPGEFELKNMAYYRGANTLVLVMRDPFGREHWLRYPFYFTDILLKKGFHEYSYNIGVLREDFGYKSDKYSDLVFSAFHRYGISDSLTIGGSGEGKKGTFTLGPQASYLIGKAGVVTLLLSGSRDDEGREGYAFSLNYEYWSRKINAWLFFKKYTEHYSTIVSEPRDEKTKRVWNKRPWLALC